MSRRRQALSIAGLLAILLGLSSCAPTSSGRVPTVARALVEYCGLLPDPPGPGADLRIALSDSVRAAHLPFAENGAETLVFAQLYECLTLLDCEGGLRPALASEWTSDREGALWRFKLRPKAQFWDGSPTTAADVIAAWLHAARRARTLGLDFPDPRLRPLA